MDKADLHDQQKVIVLVWRHGARTWDRFEGTVTKVARKFVTIEYATWAGGQVQPVKFQIEDQQVPSPYSYATHFRTLEQDAHIRREEAAYAGLRSIGLQEATLRVGTGPRLALAEVEAIVRLVEMLREGWHVDLVRVPGPVKEV